MSDKLLVPRLREVHNLIQLSVAGEAADEIERLRAALKRIAGGWPKPMQLARETLEQKK